MPLISRLLSLLGSLGATAEGPAPPEGSEAVAALLVHVACVDGVFDAAERLRLAVLFTDKLGLTPDQTARMLSRAEAERAVRPDLASLVEVAAGDADPRERQDLLAMAYSVAGANGKLTEFEDDLLWRVGRLLALDDGAIAAARAAGTAS